MGKRQETQHCSLLLLPPTYDLAWIFLPHTHGRPQLTMPSVAEWVPRNWFSQLSWFWDSGRLGDSKSCKLKVTCETHLAGLSSALLVTTETQIPGSPSQDLLECLRDQWPSQQGSEGRAGGLQPTSSSLALPAALHCGYQEPKVSLQPGRKAFPRKEAGEVQPWS